MITTIKHRVLAGFLRIIPYLIAEVKENNNFNSPPLLEDDAPRTLLNARGWSQQTKISIAT